MMPCLQGILNPNLTARAIDQAVINILYILCHQKRGAFDHG